MATLKQFSPSTNLTFDTVESDRIRIFQSLLSSETVGLCLDLSCVTHCDSAGLALLIETKRLCRHYDKAFKIEGMPKAIYALAKFCGVEAIL